MDESARTTDEIKDAARTDPSDVVPQLRRIDVADIKAALWQGVEDFNAMRTYVLFIGLFYALIGFILIRMIFSYQFIELAFPIVAGFALVGPFVSVGLMELSRRRQAGLDTHWGHLLSPLTSGAGKTILALGALLLLLFLAWIGIAEQLYVATFGDRRLPLGPLTGELFTTGYGWSLIIFGNAIGALFAMLVLTISIVSFPLVLDRHVRPATAISTSVQAIRMNPKPALAWGLIVGTALLVGSLPFFLGTALAFPILGHANWHLYTRIVKR